MLYLEDYLESKYNFLTHYACPSQKRGKFKIFLVIEHLPQELRDRFTEMRELDLSVQSKYDYFVNLPFQHFVFSDNMDELEKRVNALFSDCKRYPNELPPAAEAEYQAIQKEYYKTLEDADEKVLVVNSQWLN